MARKLGDVLHYFLEDAAERSPAAGPERTPRNEAPQVPPTAIFLGPTETLRAGITWNLLVRIAERSGAATWLTDHPTTLPAAPGCDTRPIPGGAEPRDPTGPGAAPKQASPPGAPTFIHVTGPHLASVPAFGRSVHFATADPADASATLSGLAWAAVRQPQAAAHVILHGVSGAAANAAFHRLYEAAVGRHATPPAYLGCLGDEIAVYRSIWSGQSLSGRTGNEVANLAERLLGTGAPEGSNGLSGS